MTTLEETREDDLLWLELNDPSRANALSPQLIARLTDVYGRDLRAEGVRAVLLTAAGKHFSAGADLDHLRTLGTAGPESNLADSRALKALFEAVLRQPALTVAAVQGACVAGGCGLATAHDFVVAEDDARFMYSEVRIGFVAALVATFLPLRLKGADVREILLNPEFLSAARALELGLVNRVVATGRARGESKALAEQILERASSESIARTKALLLDVVGRPLDEALEIAAEANARARDTDDCRHGIATFLETKAPPKWR
ncbi:MAG: enoyl-CoA hydratase/isomerase family protein [Acidobacteria bacterium]|nr:enoyl-CoA hydratase/isomerase family protein [Acidobacteriota bacterium]